MPEHIRGYGHVKDAHLKTAKTRAGGAARGVPLAGARAETGGGEDYGVVHRLPVGRASARRDIPQAFRLAHKRMAARLPPPQSLGVFTHQFVQQPRGRMPL